MDDEFDLPDDGFGFYNTGIEEEESEPSQTVVEEQHMI